MKLIIDVDEDNYNAICSDKGYSYANTMWWIIRNGTPYNPSGDCISREALKDITYINKGNFNTVEGIREWIDNAPAVKQQTDEWKEWTDERWGGTTIYCPYCKEEALEKYSDGLHRQVKSNFCPNCGLKLEKGGAE